MPSSQDPKDYGTDPGDDINPLAALLGLDDTAEIPAVCQTCIHYNRGVGLCGYHQRPTTALDTCEFHDDGKHDNPF